MKFIYLYGPPAVGKLTVANELASLTDLKVFHNHLTIDLVKPFFEFGSESFFELNAKLRLTIFEMASKENIPGLIFTSCYSYPKDNRRIKKLMHRVRKYGWEIFFVRLYTTIGELKQRVTQPSRESYGKLKTAHGLEKFMEQWNLTTPIPFVESLHIDNTQLTPTQVAVMIKDHYNL